jgi:hypothetical protein
MFIIMFAATIAVICVVMMIGVWETGILGFVVVLLYTLSILIMYDEIITRALV